MLTLVWLGITLAGVLLGYIGELVLERLDAEVSVLVNKLAVTRSQDDERQTDAL
jgi:hypothetical protein